jgi:hypothetical protein
MASRRTSDSQIGNAVCLGTFAVDRTFLGSRSGTGTERSRYAEAVVCQSFTVNT